VTGKFSHNLYESKDGGTKSSLEVDADFVGLIPTEKKTNSDGPGW
jgi:hypothetical protein